jgi:site-specific recombinase XerD
VKRPQNVISGPHAWESPPLQDLLTLWYLDLRVARRTPNTLHSYRARWDLFLKRTGLIRLEELTASAVKAYLVALEDEYHNRPATVAIAFRGFRAFVAWADREDYPVHESLLASKRSSRSWFRVPAPRVPQEEPKVFTEAQLLQLATLGAPRVVAGGHRHLENDTGRCYGLLARVLAATGLRVSEALALVVDDLRAVERGPEWSDGDAPAFLHVRRAKSHIARAVPLKTTLYSELLDYLAHERPATACPNLFTNRGQPLVYDGVRQWYQRASRQLGFRINAHRFRATFATRFLARHPGEIETLRRLLGHQDFTIINRYVRLSTADLGHGWEDK